MKQKAEPVTVVKKERRRNFTAEEVQVIMQEAGKNTTVIKGRFTPTITSEAKEKEWISITKSVNSINGEGEGNGGMFGRNGSTPLQQSARTKLRNIDKEQRKTGGGTSSLLSTPSQQGRKPCYRQYSRNNGLWNSRGINTAAVSRSGRSLATSGGLISYSNLLLNDLSNESEISFDLNSNPRSSTPIPSPDSSQHSLQPIQIPSSQPTPEPSSQLQPSPLATQTSSRNPPARATTGSIRSSRTVTRDVRNDEFKQLLAEQKRTNDIMEEFLKLKRARYASMGYISQ